MFTVYFESKFKRQLKKMDNTDAVEVIKFIETELSGCTNPRRLGRNLVGNHKGLWRYRVGSLRIVCKINDVGQKILAKAVGPRCAIYNMA
mgnify:FL=1